jgi:branched-chain amino acid transport system substrate-binding protein
VLAVHGALRLRHRGAGQGHRQRGGQAGRQEWFFLTADYAFGHSLENDTAAVVKANGGTVVGGAPPAVGVGLLVVPAAGAGVEGEILGLANAGGDTINSIKAAKEFGITKT